jgi:hypothetical protein
MKKIFTISLTLFILVTFSMVIHLQISHAGKFNPSMGTGFRCGNLLMQEGLHKAQVVYNCGEPFMTEKSYVDSYGEVEKLIYGPDAGYFYVLYFFVGKLIGIEEVRQ